MPVGYGDNPPVPPRSTDAEARKPRRGEAQRDGGPAAGPHDEPALANPDATPGTGALPNPATRGDADAATG